MCISYEGDKICGVGSFGKRFSRKDCVLRNTEVSASLVSHWITMVSCLPHTQVYRGYVVRKRVAQMRTDREREEGKRDQPEEEDKEEEGEGVVLSVPTSGDDTSGERRR